METEIWKDIEYYPGIRNDMYQISNLGRVREKYTKRIKKLCPSEKGYLRTAFTDENGNRSDKAFKVSKYIIWNIWKKRSWKHVSDKYF